ncbi:unnamed protein product [Phaeothamnion confervicola]
MSYGAVGYRAGLYAGGHGGFAGNDYEEDEGAMLLDRDFVEISDVPLRRSFGRRHVIGFLCVTTMAAAATFVGTRLAGSSSSSRLAGTAGADPPTQLGALWVIGFPKVAAGAATAELANRVAAMSDQKVMYSALDDEAKSSLFSDFKTAHGRRYGAGTDEERSRFETFKSNLAEIDRLNAASPLALYGVTKYADLTAEERQVLRHQQDFANLDAIRASLPQHLFASAPLGPQSRMLPRSQKAAAAAAAGGATVASASDLTPVIRGGDGNDRTDDEFADSERDRGYNDNHNEAMAAIAAAAAARGAAAAAATAVDATVASASDLTPVIRDGSASVAEEFADSGRDRGYENNHNVDGDRHGHSRRRLKSSTSKWDAGQVAWLSEDDCAACDRYPHFSTYTYDTMPTSFDWRHFGAVTDVKNQKYCGSCWTFSTAADIEGTWYLATGESVSRSEQQLVACDNNPGYTEGCNGGFPYAAMDYVIEAGGIVSDDAYPYKGLCMDDACGQNIYYGAPVCDTTTLNDELKAKSVAHIGGWQMVAMGAEYESLLTLGMLKNGPISISFNSEGMEFYVHGVTGCPAEEFGEEFCQAGGIDDLLPCEPTYLDHAVLVVGYGVQDGVKFWVIKNSWGTDWGEDGYYRMLRGTNHCGVANMAVHSVVKNV